MEEFEQIWARQAGHLGLDNETGIRKREIRVNNLTSSSTRRKLASFKERNKSYEIVDNSMKILVSEEMSLKELFGGEDGKNGKDGIIYFQRPLRNQRHLLKKCDLETSKRPVPLSHPRFEEFRSWQLVNNIRDGKGKLSDSQKQEVINLINSREKSFKFEENKKKAWS